MDIQQALKDVSDKLIQGYPTHIPAPVLVSKQGDNLYLEWQGVGDPSLDIDLRSLEAWFHAFNAQGDADVEADFTLDTADGWEKLFVLLGECLAGSDTATNSPPKD